ncbi:uncharacterized protein LOC113295864 [Papaver somniferum]|uniref:uncharacterized protein LOC113295864 n=1 Tax=Papaver somniferum TaxID=3469 RepID=UPI000E6F929D|nr:uncharacterized protein LOC113295864 [Papaver somniferum]
MEICHNVQLPEICGGEDALIWTENLKGKFSVTDAFKNIRHKEQEPKSLDDIWRSASKCSSLIKQVWITAACTIIKELWFQKNKKFFENIKPNAQAFKCRILKLVHEGGLRITGTKWNQAYDNEIIARFDLGTRFSKFQLIKSCQWSPPEIGFVMFCCDGSSFGNPGAAGFGVVVRTSDCQVAATLSGGIGIASNYLAESYGVICAMELADQWNMKKIIIVSDLKTVIA